ncbi:MAG: hypothetical protein RL158_1028 [Bacteroidota bacterium]|jgi:hypothetical protein
MLSNFHLMSDNDKKLLVAKILHEINYSQASFDLITSLIKVWEQYPTRQAQFFNTQNTYNGITKN